MPKRRRSSKKSPGLRSMTEVNRVARSIANRTKRFAKKTGATK